MFISKTPLGVPSCTPSMRALHERYLGCLRSRSPDFMTPGPVEVVGYVSSLPPPNAPAYPPLPLKLVPSCRSMIIALRSSSFLLSLSLMLLHSIMDLLHTARAASGRGEPQHLQCRRGACLRGLPRNDPRDAMCVSDG